jgi:F5/8 type C domain/Pectate lyase superfamily protein/Abnormal spindle-like microcephaly-assoc'd, ASPM-SPD-2-Hydin
MLTPMNDHEQSRFTRSLTGWRPRSGNRQRPVWRRSVRRRGRFTAVLVAALAALVGIVLPALTPAHANAQAGTPPYWSTSPFAVPSGTGASVPFTEYAAVNAATNGSDIGPSFAQGTLPSEAVGREAVQLTAQGQYVKFTLTSAANAFDLHYALPQGDSGTLSVYVNGTELSQQLSLTSAYSYITTSDITGSDTHKFYDDARMLLGQTVAAGSTVTFQVNSGNTALPYTINVADFFNVGAAASQPANSVSVSSYGADPTGKNNSTSAFNSAISAASSAGESVWIPTGTYLISSPLTVTSATIEGAGYWYSVIDSNEMIDNTSADSGAINLSNFAIMGNTVGRNDSSTENAIDGSLGTGWTVNSLWIQDTNVGFWLQYGNSNCTVENSIVLSTDADGLNFNGNATNCTVKNNFLRDTGDDGLAIWSYPAADSGITFSNNTIESPTLANGIADYGGANNTIENNVIADSNALGSGLTISNEQFLSPGFTPLSGTVTVSGNYLIRDGAYNPNWGHPMSAVQFDAYDYAFSGVTVNYSGGAILDSPYSAFELVSGDGDGNAISGVNISDVNVQNLGTVVMQAETSGSASVSGVTASGVGVAGTYDDGYDSGTSTPGAFTFNLGSGNSGWSLTPQLTAFPEPASPGALTASPASVSFGDVASGSTSSPQAVTVSNPGSSAASVSSISVSGDFTQTNNCGTSIAANGSCTVNVTFAPSSGGALTGTLSVTSSAPSSPLTVALSGTGVSSTTNLALNQPITASSYYETYVAANANDGNPSTYWESSDGAAYPQTITVNLGSVQSIGSITLDLPPSSAWSTRTETLSVLGSNNDSTFTQIVASAGYTFNPSTGNTVTISLPSGTSAQYVELSFTGNTGWSAAQLSEFEVFPGGGSSGSSSALTASPTSVPFGDEVTGQDSSAQSVTVTNPGSSAASVSSISVSGPFAQTNNCGSSIAAGGSCTVSVQFEPTATGNATGTLSVASSAANSPLTVPLSGTGTTTSTDLALNQPATASGYTQTYVPSNAVDGNTSTYWESTDNDFPQWFQVDLGSSVSIGKIVMDLPPPSSWATRTQTITIQGSTNGTTWSTIEPSTGYVFNPSTGNSVTVTFAATSVRYLKLTFTANTGWPAGQLSELDVYAS